MVSSDVFNNTDNPQCELFKVVCNIYPLDYPTPFMRFKEFSNSIYNNFEIFWQNGK